MAPWGPVGPRAHTGRREVKPPDGLCIPPLMSSAGGRNCARLTALKAPGATTWLLPPPLGVAPLSNKVSSHAHRMRLGLPLYNGKHIRKCICDKLLLDTNHLQTCRSLKGGGRIHRHNDVVNILAKYIRRAGGHAIIEPPSCDTSSRRRVDIDARMGSLHLHIDVKILEPTADSYVLHENSVLGASIEAEKKKSKKHKANAEKVGAIFLPYILESLGGIAPQARSLNMQIIRYAEDQKEIDDRDVFLAALKSEIAIAVQFGCWKMTTLGVQQSRVAKFIPNPGPKMDDFVDTLLDGPHPLVINRESRLKQNEKENEENDTKEKEEEKKYKEKILSSSSFSSSSSSSSSHSSSSTSSKFSSHFPLPPIPVMISPDSSSVLVSSSSSSSDSILPSSSPRPHNENEKDERNEKKDFEDTFEEETEETLYRGSETESSCSGLATELSPSQSSTVNTPQKKLIISKENQTKTPDTEPPGSPIFKIRSSNLISVTSSNSSRELNKQNSKKMPKGEMVSRSKGNKENVPTLLYNKASTITQRHIANCPLLSDNKSTTLLNLKPNKNFLEKKTKKRNDSNT